LDNDELVNLLARCALKDQKAVALLYQKTAAYLNAVAYRILGSTECSNDVLQESFVQIWENASTYTSNEANPLTWMTSIVRYRAIDKLRRERRHQNRPRTEEENNILIYTPGGVQPDDHHRRLRLNVEIEKCLDAMNEHFNKSVRLAYLYGYSREELAETLGTNLNTVKSWLRRGSSRLKECLQGSYP